MDFTFGYNACIIIAETHISTLLRHEEHLEPWNISLTNFNAQFFIQ
jgi:hypothetical protein